MSTTSSRRRARRLGLVAAAAAALVTASIAYSRTRKVPAKAPAGAPAITPTKTSAKTHGKQSVTPRQKRLASAAAPLAAKKRLLYTTYFYTANEAVVHGYAKDTHVRIVSLERKGTVWKGVVGVGETRLVNTGRGAFAFVSDKKASILVGTPSRCAVVGYWVRDERGSFLSKRFFTRLPSAVSNGGERVIVWAWENTRIKIIDRRPKRQSRTLYSARIRANGHYEITGAALRRLNGAVLEIRADKPVIGVQVYYDEGFFVQSSNGNASGRHFLTFVGRITDGRNDLSMFAYKQAAKVAVTDIKSGKAIWRGTIKPGKLHTLTLTDRYVRIDSDVSISAAVAPYAHHLGSSYMEHHFAAGQEGTGVEDDLMLTTPRELWLFSYFDQNPITVTDGHSGRVVWRGTLDAGHAAPVHPGRGFYRVRSLKGVSAMGGAMACGAEFSPAGRLFALDEALFKVLAQIRRARQKRAAARGQRWTRAQAQAPLTKTELDQVVHAARRHTRRAAPAAAAEVRERIKKMQSR
ncbi:MAG: hypothetical protein KC503_07880 [Myxococcales bacterium]|nr:hypothetical protein [Myxococcales bacterium]